MARLRAEHDATEDAGTRAVLLHEIAVLEEVLGDESAAARDLLSAVNAEPDFREPLERLVCIIEHRQSYKNLGKLLERLEQVAELPEERTRAMLERIDFMLSQESDVEAARAAIERALEEKSDEVSLILMREIVAARQGDVAARLTALSARPALSQNAQWRTLLLIDLARERLAQGETDIALSALMLAVDEESASTFEALLLLEQAARSAERSEVAAEALHAQSVLLRQALDDEKSGDERGVPRSQRSAAHVAECLLRAGNAEQARGNLHQAIAHFDKALERLPSDPILSHARLDAAQIAGDTEAAARLARQQLEQGVGGALGAGLWLLIAEHAAESGDASDALAAVTHALELDPGSIPALALKLDLLSSGHDAAALATALETAAEQLTTDDAKARYYVLAADQWARIAQDNAAAKTALSQAGMYGTPALDLARIARMMAAVVGDVSWYDEATRRLAASGPPAPEAVRLWYEVARGRLLRGEATAGAALATLATTAGGGWIGNALLAYVAPLAAAAGSSDEALAALAEAEADPAAGRALRTVRALRALMDGRVDAAVSELEALHEADGGDPATTRAYADLLRLRGQLPRAAAALRACAAERDDDLGAALELEAGFLLWHAGDYAAAVACFESGADRTEAARPLLGWALRAAAPDDLDARRRTLATEAGDLARLERFALEIGRDGDAARAGEAIAEPSAQDSEIASAIALARALSPSGEQAHQLALDTITVWGSTAKSVARGARYLEQLRAKNDASDIAEAAREWAESDLSANAALEWLAACVTSRDVAGEVAARRALALRLDGELASQLYAGASITSLLNDSDSEQLLAGDEPVARLVNIELALPGRDPRPRARALSGAADVLGSTSAALSRALAGYNFLAAGDIAAALATFREVVAALPEDIIGWEGLRAAAQAAGERATVAEACAALGDAVADDARGAALWEEAALILIDELADAERGEFALSRAVARDVRRFVAFDRLFRMLRARKDSTRVLDLIGARLQVTENPDEIAKLFWERARALRQAGDRDEALQALDNVTMLEPDHVGALALSGEIFITEGRFSEAATALARLATLEEAPAKQRLMSGVAAVDLYENKLDEIEKALDVLVGLYRAGLSTPPVRERLARAAAKVGAWEQATEVLEELMNERTTREGRIEAARLAMVIHRDRRHDPAGAAHAVVKLLTEQPDDAEALELVLDRAVPELEARNLLGRARDRLVRSLVEEPLDAERVERLARVAKELRNAPLRQAALGALIALGEGSEVIDRELQLLDQRVTHLPQIAIDEAALPELADPEDRGPLPKLMYTLATTLAAALGPALAAFGVGKRERVDPRAGLPLRNEIAAWAGALGIGDFDLYVGGRDPHGVYAVATERPAILVGPVVSAPLSQAHRQALARELFALRRGTTILRHREATDIAALVVAACRLAGVDLPAPTYAMLGEFERVLGKEMPRKVKKSLPELCAPIAAARADVVTWVRAAVASLDRMAAIAAGDVSWVLSDGRADARGSLGASLEAQDRARRLLSFVLSPTYLQLRDQLGMGVR